MTDENANLPPPPARILLIVIIALSAELLNGQTYVNREWVKNYGSPDTIEWQASATDIWGQLVTAGNTQTPGQQADILVTTFNDIGGITWQYTWNGPKNKSDYGAAVVCDPNGNTYVAGASHYSNDSVFDIVLLKFDWQGNLLWQSNYDGTGGADYPLEMALDNAGNIYITGASEGNGSGLDIITLKFNTSGSLQWNARYDYNTGTDIGGDIIVNASGSRISVTGGSEDTSATWDYTTLLYNGSGQQLNSNRQSSGQANMDKPKDIVKDANKNYYITGMSFNGSDMDIKLIKLDSTLSPQWVQTYHAGNEGSNCLTIDDSNNLYIGGWQDQSPGVRNFLLLKYTPGGTLAWQRTLSPVQGKPMAQITECTTTDGKTINITGLAANGFNSDIVTAQYTTSGELSWIKAWENVSGSIDYPTGIKQVGDDIYVSGRSIDLTGIKWVTIKYSFFEKPSEIFYDSLNNPLWIKDELIIRFDPSIVVDSIIDNREIIFGNLSNFVSSQVEADIYDSLATIDTIPRPWKSIAIKIYRNLTTDDTISISRLGEEVYIPSFWAGLLVTLPTGTDVNSVAEKISTVENVLYAEPNYLAVFYSTPIDTLYDSLQPNLHPISNYPDGHINVEPAWDFSVGYDFVKVGIYDDGINWQHEDFEIKQPFSQTILNTKIQGWDYFTYTHIGSSPPPAATHGTSIAGIIGGLRNNTFLYTPNFAPGIAGIAGGHYAHAVKNKGVSLYAMKINNGPYSFVPLSMVAQAIEEGASDIPGNHNAFALDIMNYCFGYETFGPPKELSKAVEYAWKNHVTQVAARGQGVTNVDPHGNPIYLNQDSYPACLRDEWVITVSASGTDGTLKSFINENQSDPNDHFIPYIAGGAWGYGSVANYYNGKIDVLAPGTSALVTSMASGNNYAIFNGTSASAPHVTGLAGLLLSYMNNQNSSAINLAPEDVEELTVRYAKNYSSGHNLNSGYGLVDAGNSFSRLEKPYYNIVHVPNNSSQKTHISTTYDTTVALYYQEPLPVVNLPSSRLYAAEEYTVEIRYDFSIQYDSLFGTWVRHSSGNAYQKFPYFIPSFIYPKWVYLPSIRVPYGGEFSSTPDSSMANLKAKVYKVIYDSTSNTPISPPVWLPVNPYDVEVPFTMHIYNDTGGATGLFHSERKKIQLKLSPNPVSTQLVVDFSTTGHYLLEIGVTDLYGRSVMKPQKVVTPEGRITINTQSLLPGVYLLACYADGVKCKTEKFVVIR